MSYDLVYVLGPRYPLNLVNSLIIWLGTLYPIEFTVEIIMIHYVTLVTDTPSSL